MFFWWNVHGLGVICMKDNYNCGYEIFLVVLENILFGQKMFVSRNLNGWIFASER